MGCRGRCRLCVQLARLLVWWEMVVVGVGAQPPCSLDDVAVMEDFDVSKFIGRWYEVEWIAATYQDSGNSWINYFQHYTADDFGVVTGYYSGKDPNTNECYFGGLVNLKTKTHPAKMRQYREKKKLILDYWVLDTDYSSYAVVYSCEVPANDMNNTCNTAVSWLWGRGKSLPEDVKARARDTFRDLCMNMTLLYVTGFVGDDCEPDTSGSVSTTVTMPGQPVFLLTLSLVLWMVLKVAVNCP
ncbi:retinol-binding protein 4-A-like isoform X2 [Babylonia areolata]|uniref:retinol-binding protein 4-A-like isoform X1 n=1 Tax=Babylonia areolata TaxID=304850 RepID=UPI003FCFCBBE